MRWELYSEVVVELLRALCASTTAAAMKSVGVGVRVIVVVIWWVWVKTKVGEVGFGIRIPEKLSWRAVLSEYV